MQWSQLRKRLLDRVADRIRSRIDIQQTRYRNAPDQEGEIWLTVDKERIFSAGSASYLSKLDALIDELHHQNGDWSEAHEQARPIVEASGLMLLEKVNDDLRDSLNQSIDEMLEHSNPLVRGLAILDSRYGKRRIAAFDACGEHPLVQRLFAMRCEAEKVRRTGTSDNAEASGRLP